jgi:hypothetical protein
MKITFNAFNAKVCGMRLKNDRKACKNLPPRPYGHPSFPKEGTLFCKSFLRKISSFPEGGVPEPTGKGEVVALYCFIKFKCVERDLNV